MYDIIVSRICYALNCAIIATHSKGRGVRNCRNHVCMWHLADHVQRTLEHEGLPSDEVSVTRAIVLYAPSLAKSWHQYSLMANRAVSRYNLALAAGRYSE